MRDEILSYDEEFDEIFTILADKDDSKLGSALNKLYNLDTTVVPRLVSALTSDNPVLAQNAAFALNILSARIMNEAMKLLESGSSGHTYTLNVLAVFSFSGVSNKIVDIALHSTDEALRVQAISILGNKFEGGVIETLFELMQDESVEIRKAIYEALGKLRTVQAVEPLISALNDLNHEIRIGAAQALRTMGDKRAVEPLITRLKDRNADVRVEAAHSLGRLKDHRATDALLKALKDHDVVVQEAVAAALGQLKDKKALKPLEEALFNRSVYVLEYVCWALGELGDEKTIILLEEAKQTNVKSQIKMDAKQTSIVEQEIDEAITKIKARIDNAISSV